MLNGRKQPGCMYERDVPRSREPVWGEWSKGPWPLELESGIGVGGPPKQPMEGQAHSRVT